MPVHFSTFNKTNHSPISHWGLKKQDWSESVCWATNKPNVHSDVWFRFDCSLVHSWAPWRVGEEIYTENRCFYGANSKLKFKHVKSQKVDSHVRSRSSSSLLFLGYLYFGLNCCERVKLTHRVSIFRSRVTHREHKINLADLISQCPGWDAKQGSIFWEVLQWQDTSIPRLNSACWHVYAHYACDVTNLTIIPMFSLQLRPSWSLAKKKVLVFEMIDSHSLICLIAAVCDWSRCFKRLWS